MSVKDTLIAEAKKWNGYLEKASNSQLSNFTANAGSANYTIFAVNYCDYYGESLNVYQGQAWCAMFVSVMFANAFGADIAEQMIYGHYAYCPYGVNNFKSNGSWYSSPQAGDIIFFGSSGTATHPGIVYAVESAKVYTVEGNTSSASGVVANGGAVALKSYSLSYAKILGYGRPNWSLAEAATITEYTEINDIIWELAHRRIISNSDLWLQKCAEDSNIYWFCRKLCQYIRTKQIGETADYAYTDISEIVWDLNYRGIISDTALWTDYCNNDSDVYNLLQKGLHYCRTY